MTSNYSTQPRPRKKKKCKLKKKKTCLNRQTLKQTNKNQRTTSVGHFHSLLCQWIVQSTIVCYVVAHCSWFYFVFFNKAPPVWYNTWSQLIGFLLLLFDWLKFYGSFCLFINLSVVSWICRLVCFFFFFFLFV